MSTNWIGEQREEVGCGHGKKTQLRRRVRMVLNLCGRWGALLAGEGHVGTSWTEGGLPHLKCVTLVRRAGITWMWRQGRNNPLASSGERYKTRVLEKMSSPQTKLKPRVSYDPSRYSDAGDFSARSTSTLTDRDTTIDSQKYGCNERKYNSKQLTMFHSQQCDMYSNHC